MNPLLLRRRGVIGAGGGEIPASIPDLSLWLAADLVTGKAHGDNLPTWLDGSPQGNNAGNSNAAQQPIYRTGILNGLPAIYFTGGDQLYVSDGGGVSNKVAWGDHVSIFALTKRDANNSNGSIFDCANDLSFAASDGIRFDQNGNARLGISTGTGTFTQKTLGAVWAIQAGRYDGSTQELWTDGGTPVTSSAESGPISYAGIGATRIGQLHGGTSNNWMVGYMAEIVIVDRALSDAEMNEVGAYLADKWAQTWSPIS